MSHISAQLRRRVIRRARERCEYCGLSQDGQETTFHVDHVRPSSSGGTTVFDNLAIACVSCSLKKGALSWAVDPLSGETSQLYSPRRDRWSDHFRWENSRIVGLTSIGRATIAALDLNRDLIVAIRAEERLRGRHPPPE